MINWLGNQNCPSDNEEGRGWAVERWENGSLRTAIFATREEAVSFETAYVNGEAEF